MYDAMRKFYACLFLLPLSVIGCSQSSNTYTSRLQSIASDTQVISMYYTVFTDATFASNNEMKKAATYKTEIVCFMECSQYVKEIIKQIADATRISCPSMMGTRYLLIEFSGSKFKTNVNYLKGGNIIIFNGQCYLSKQSIDDILPSPDIFERLFGKKKLIDEVRNLLQHAYRRNAVN